MISPDAESPLPCASRWAAVRSFAGFPLFTHSYWYHLACLRAVVEGGECFLPEYPLLHSAGDTFLTAAFERTSTSYAYVTIEALRSPQTIYVPYWDLMAASTSGEAELNIDLPTILKGSNLGKWDVIQLCNVLEGSATLQALEAQREFQWNRWPFPQCDYVLCQDSASFLAGLSKNFRSSLRKARNKLNKLGDVEFKSHMDASSIRPALDSFLELECHGWKGAIEGAVVQNPNITRFYQILFEEYARDPLGWVEINELRADGKLLASQLCLGRVDTLFVWKIAYDEGYQKMSPRNMLLERLITRSRWGRSCSLH